MSKAFCTIFSPSDPAHFDPWPRPRWHELSARDRQKVPNLFRLWIAFQVKLLERCLLAWESKAGVGVSLSDCKLMQIAC